VTLVTTSLKTTLRKMTQIIQASDEEKLEKALMPDNKNSTVLKCLVC
jgi:hypothetical protein